MQQWCCSSLMTACQRLARVQPQRLLPSSSMAPKQVCSSTSTCTSNIRHAASAASKLVTSWRFHSQHADQNVGQLLITLRSHAQQECRVNFSGSQSQLTKVPFKDLTYSTQHATQDAASFMSRLRATTSQGLWRQSAASLAAKQSGETSPAPQLKALVFWTGSHHADHQCSVMQTTILYYTDYFAPFRHSQDAHYTRVGAVHCGIADHLFRYSRVVAKHVTAGHIVPQEWNLVYRPRFQA